jgi:hypothetical protein
MSNFDRVKHVTRTGFENRDAARADARDFRDIGGTITEGGERADGTWGWTGEVHVHDTHKSVDGNFGCGRCGTTGRFITFVENNVPKGPGGICFRCEGKGYHTRADRARNLCHDEHAIMAAFRRDMAA